METITIRAASYESARGIIAALSDFLAELVTRPDGFCEVVINLSEVEIVALLNTLAEHVTKRADGPARLDMNGYSGRERELPRSPEPLGAANLSSHRLRPW